MMKSVYICVTVAIVVLIYFKLNKEQDFNPELDISGKNVLVTGASSGIGEQLAYHYAEMGANVFITARREQLLKKVITKCRSLGRKDAVFGYLAGDMEEYDVTAAIIISGAVSQLGGLDHVILNHGIIPDIEKWSGTEKNLHDFEVLIDVNLVSFVHLITHAMPHLRRSRFGRVGVISSLAGKVDSAYQGGYSASKFGLDGFFSALRQEFKNNKEHISVTVCNFGIITTDRCNELLDHMAKLFNFNVEKMKGEKYPTATPTDAALEIIKATSQGDRELYYPPILGSKFITQMLPVIRHIFPSILELNPEDLK